MSSLDPITQALSPSLQEWIRSLIAQGATESAGDYVRQLIIEDQERRWHAEVEKKLLESIASGPAEPMSKEEWARLREAARARLEQARRDAAA